MNHARLPALLLAVATAPTLHAAPPAPGAVAGAGASGPTTATAPASTASDPQALPTGGSVNLRLPAGGAAVYRFEAPGPGVLKVAVGGEPDLVLAVATPEGIEAGGGFSDDDEEGDWSERVEVPIDAAGVYRVLVEGYDGEVGGAGGVEIHLAAEFIAGEPEPTETLEEASIVLNRAIASPGRLAPGVDTDGRFPAVGPAVFRLDAEPGLYAVTSTSASDVYLHASAVGAEAVASVWLLPTLDDHSDQTGDADLGGDLGREGVVVAVPEDGAAWIAVGGYEGETGSFRLRVHPLTPPDPPADAAD